MKYGTASMNEAERITGGRALRGLVLLPVVLAFAAGACADDPMAPIAASAIATETPLRPAPDTSGPKIAFVNNVDGVSHIFTIAPDGSGLRRLTKGRVSSTSPAWSPDRQQIALLRPGRTTGKAVFTMDSRGRSLKQLTEFGNFDPGDPSWSPDGSTIVFSLEVPGQRPEIYTVAADGSTPPTRLTNDTLFDYNPVYSPDGSRIAFSSTVGGARDIFIMDANGQNPQQFTFCAVDCHSPSWSPDGSAIAYQRADSLMVATVATGSSVALAGGLSDGARPRWSPDGAELAYAAYSDSFGLLTDLFVIGAAGGQPRRLTSISANVRQPSWAQ